MADKDIGKVLVVGAGVAGIRSALDLAETGYEVLLTESSPAVGGVLAKLDFQFPNDHCGMCRMLPFVGRESASQFCMRKSLFHDRITILPDTEVTACSGEPGKFEVTLRTRAKRLQSEICIGDGECAAICPVEVSDEFNEGLTPRKAVYRPVPHNLPNHWVIDPEACNNCGECVNVCPVNAIDLKAEDEEQTLTVGAVILATGAGLYPAAKKPDFYSYAASPHVLTSLEFERIISASGTYQGELRRPHDGREAKRIAWIQCVGSRNHRQGRDFCSSICCMFALKEAVLAKERGGPDTDAAIFYMDLRTFGKDYYRYRESAERDKGVRLVRCRPQSVHLTPDGDPIVRYFDDQGAAQEEEFDLVVLATGQTPPTEVKELQRVFGFETNRYGFAETAGDTGLGTTAPGVFTCGSFTGLKDISDALVQGSAAAAEASTLMQEKGLQVQSEPKRPAQRNVDRELPRVAVMLCRWPRHEGAQSIDFDAFAERLRELDAVTEVHVVEEMCRGGQHDAARCLRDSKANRVLFAACLPYMYKRGLKQLAEMAGFNATLVDVVDLRSEIRRAALKSNGKTVEQYSQEYLYNALQSLCAKDPVHVTHIPVEKRALVVGGGIAGMQAARTLSRHGIDVSLVERSEELGGQARNLHTSLDGVDPKALVERLVAEVATDANIRVLTDTEVTDTQGSVGRFRTTLRSSNGTEERLRHGAIILATGGKESPAGSDYGYDQSDQVQTQEELEHALATGEATADSLGTVVMIQCVGSREKGRRDYCSRLCCSSALKNARKILEVNPEARVMVLYRDMMTYGFNEQYYSEARRQGILFSTYTLDRKPQVELVEGKPQVTYLDEVLGREVSLSADRLVLSTGVVPRAQEPLAKDLDVVLNEDGFFDEADYKFRPVEMLKEGVYVCGLAHSPRSMTESMTMAEAAAQRALTVLSQRELTSARLVSRVKKSVCAVCEICVNVCPYQARFIDPDDNVVVVDELACQGCGICTAACPSGAAALTGQANQQIMATLDAQLSGLAVI